LNLVHLVYYAYNIIYENHDNALLNLQSSNMDHQQCGA